MHVPAPSDPARRACLLAAWGTAWLAGRVSADDLLDAVQDTDEPHLVRWDGDSTGLPLALGRLRAAGVTRLRVALPAPGDPAGLAGSLGEAALATGAAVLAEDAAVGWVPVVSAHGNDADGYTVLVRWDAWPLPVSLGPPVEDGVGAAERTLAEAVREAASALARLEVARWRPEFGEVLAGLRHRARTGHPLLALPPGAPSRAQEVVDLAERLRVVVDLARADPAGGAVSGWQARDRDSWLRNLEGAARYATVTAVNSVPAAV